MAVGVSQKQITLGGDKLANYLTMIGHICADLNQGALVAILPFLLVAHPEYSYVSVTMLVLASNIASAVIQPVFGMLGDRFHIPWVMSLGIFLAGFGMFLIGVVDSYWLVVAAAMFSGIGVAMFHPEGGRIANLSAGVRKANGMSIFAVGGNVGFFVGPIITAWALSVFGMAGTAVFLIPAIGCPVLLLVFNKRFMQLDKEGAALATGDGQTKKDNWPRFSIVLTALSLRSVVQYGLLTFIPLYVMNVLGYPETVSSLTLSFYSVCSAVATALSGKASEKIGSLRLIVVCFLSLAILTTLFSFSSTLVVAVGIAMIMSVASCIFNASTVAYGMDCVPNSLGMASGLSYGLAICFGGIAEPFLGIAGDAYGLPPVLLILAAISLVGAGVGLILQRKEKTQT